MSTTSNVFPPFMAIGAETVPRHELMIRTLAALQQAEVRYCLLRGYEELDQPAEHHELDLLVHRADLAALERVAFEMGCGRLPGRAADGHRFYVTFDVPTGSWLKLDVVTDLRYGRPGRHLGLDLTGQCLAARRRRPLAWVPGLADEALTLTLHCLLDKERFDARHRRRLVALIEEIDRAADVERATTDLFAAHLGGAASWPALREAIAADAWEELLARRAAIARRLWRGAPIPTGRRWITAGAARLGRPLTGVLGRGGATIALLGPDGAGKSTIARALVDDRQLRARRLYMGWSGGDDAAASGGRTFRFLRRLCVGWQRSAVAAYHRRRGRNVIFDRHPCEAAADEQPATLGRRLRQRLLIGTSPLPDVALVLDAPGDVLHARSGQYSPERLERQRERYRQLARRLPATTVIDVMQSTDAVVRQIKACIWRRLIVDRTTGPATSGSSR